MLILFTFLGNNFLVFTITVWLASEGKAMAYDKSVFLDRVIEEYIKLREPIGSETLKSSLEFTISSATIRNYFRFFMQEGILVQSHVSSGRIPTIRALKNYWKGKIRDFDLHIRFDQLCRAAREFEVFILLRRRSGLVLEGLKNLEGKFLVLEFKDQRVPLPYEPKLERFLTEFIGLMLEDILSICYQVMTRELFEGLRSLHSRYLSYFFPHAISLFLKYREYEDLFFEILDGGILSRVSVGTFFDPILPEGFLGVLQNIKYQTQKKEIQEGEMLVIGPLISNYQDFYRCITAES